MYQEKFGQDLRDVLQKLTSVSRRNCPLYQNYVGYPPPTTSIAVVRLTVQGPFQLTSLMLLDKLRVEFGQLSVRVDGGYKLYKTQTSTSVRWRSGSSRSIAYVLILRALLNICS